MRDFFPTLRLQDGHASVDEWSIWGSSMINYKAVGIGSGITGSGFTHMILDDIIKGYYEAMNQLYCDRTLDIVTGTMLSRGNADLHYFFNQTRWSSIEPYHIICLLYTSDAADE